MKKVIFRNETNKLTIIENTFVIIMLLLIVMFSVPSLSSSIRELFLPFFHPPYSGTSMISTGIIGWMPPELSQNDNNAVYSYKDINLTGGAKIIGNTVSNLGTAFRFPLPNFPRFPYGTLSPKGVIEPEDAYEPLMLSDNGYFEKITINSSLYINIGNRGDSREIIVDHLDLGSKGKLNLIGQGLLKLYVRKGFTFSDNASINGDGSPDSLILYYQGKDPLSIIDGTQVFVGSIYAETADLVIKGGSPVIFGNVIVGGSSVIIENTSFRGKQFLLYAPEAKVNISGTSDIEGKLIVSQLVVTSNAIIRYLPLALDNRFKWQE